MNTALDIAKYVINECLERGTPVSNLKLQKILYYIQGTFLAKLGYAAFEEDVLAWRHGPVIPEVYYEFNFYVANNIITKHYTDIQFKQKEKDIVTNIIKDKIRYSAWDLVEKTHLESPWEDNYEPNMNNVIPIGSMENYFKKQMEI